jgi:hypothetical protein
VGPGGPSRPQLSSPNNNGTMNITMEQWKFSMEQWKWNNGNFPLLYSLLVGKFSDGKKGYLFQMNGISQNYEWIITNHEWMWIVTKL